jgi:uncharacterized membrane protein
MSAAITSFITLAVAGVVDAGYLVWKHYKHNSTPLVCPLDHDCSKVTESKWAQVLGIRNEVLGLLFYIAMLSAGFLLFFRSGSANILLSIKLATAVGALFSLFLIWVQFYKVKDYCFYCMISALINILLLVNSFFL